MRRALFACLLVTRAAVSPALAQDVGTCPPPAATAPPTAQQVQEGLAHARDRGFLWRLTKGDHSSYLYGTIHMARLEWAFPGPKTTQALREIDTVALEVDPLDPKTRQVISSGMKDAMVLTFLASRREGLELGYGIDAVLAGFGRAAKKRVVALETTDAQVRAGRAATGGGSVASLEKALDELESGRTAANLARMASLWAEADLAQPWGCRA